MLSSLSPAHNHKTSPYDSDKSNFPRSHLAQQYAYHLNSSPFYVYKISNRNGCRFLSFQNLSFGHNHRKRLLNTMSCQCLPRYLNPFRVRKIHITKGKALSLKNQTEKYPTLVQYYHLTNLDRNFQYENILKHLLC